MTRKNGLILLLAGVAALVVPVVLDEIGAWFPAVQFLGWAGFLMFAAGVLTLASLGLRRD